MESAFAGFGTVDLDNPALKALREIVSFKGKLNSRVDCKMFKQHIFKKSFGLLNSNVKKDREFRQALSGIAFIPELSLDNNNNVKEAISTFINLSIHEVTGISLFEFLNMSVEANNVLVATIQDISEKATNDINKAVV